MDRKPIFVSHAFILELKKFWLLSWIIVHDLLCIWTIKGNSKVTFRWLSLFLFLEIIFIDSICCACSTKWSRIESLKHQISLWVILCPLKLRLLICPINGCSYDFKEWIRACLCKANILWHVLESLNNVEFAIAFN